MRKPHLSSSWKRYAFCFVQIIFLTINFSLFGQGQSITVDLAKIDKETDCTTCFKFSPNKAESFDLKKNTKITFTGYKTDQILAIKILNAQGNEVSGGFTVSQNEIEEAKIAKNGKIALTLSNGTIHEFTDRPTGLGSNPFVLSVAINGNDAVKSRVIGTVQELGGRNMFANNQPSSQEVGATGIALYDAIAILNSQRNNNKDYLKILSSYAKEELKSDGDVIEKFNDNKLLLKSIRLNTGAQGAKNRSAFQTAINRGKNANVATFADGLAQFMIKRAEEEMSVYFFQKLEKLFGIYPEFKVFFPNTIQLLRRIELNNYSNYLQSLQQSFESDCIELSGRLMRLEYLQDNTQCIGNAKQVKECKERMDAYKKFFASEEGFNYLSFLFITDKFIKETNPADIISQYTDYVIAKKDTADQLNGGPNGIVKYSPNDTYFIPTLKLSKLISENLKNTDANEVYASPADIKTMLNNDSILNIYLGLLYEVNRAPAYSISFGTEKDSLSGIINRYATEEGGNNIIGYFKDVINQTNTINQNIIEIRKKLAVNGVFTYVDYTNYYRSLTGFFKTASNTDKLKQDILDRDNLIKIQHGLQLAEYAGNIYFDVSTNNYGSAIFNVVAILDATLKQNFRFRQEFLKYGTFIGNVAQAKSSDEVESAIDAAVLPVGSSRIKKQSAFNISINSYLGLYGGAENFKVVLPGNGDSNGKDNWKPTLGITAPIGVALSWGLYSYKSSQKIKEEGSISLFVPLIDIGAFVNFRLEDENTALLPEVSLSNIIAPGAYLIYGFPNAPFSIGGGLQLSPSLRKITKANATVDPNNPPVANIDKGNAYRFSVFFAVDIPFFNIMTKPRNIR
jgi:hypothetical protein